MIAVSSELEETGRAWCRGALSDAQCEYLAQCTAHEGRPGRRISGEGLAVTIGAGSVIGALAEKVLPGARPVRIVAFDKSGTANWSVPWHQDRVAALAARHEADGFSNWARKDGVWHAEPPLALLEAMVFARVHLDDCDAYSGSLELALGSHRLGRVPAGEARERAEACEIEICEARRGDVLFVKALTLHRSASSQSTNQRRTLRIDYCASALPAPLDWALPADASP